MTNRTRTFLRSAFARVRGSAGWKLTVATLGPAETSSACVAHRIVRAVAASDAVCLFDTFEEAGAHVVSDPRALLLVPNAYPSLNTFHFDARLGLAGCFVHPVPRYGIACRTNTPVTAESEITIASQPAPLPMAKDFLARFATGRIVLSSSTAAAAEAVANGMAEYCVTNAVAAAAYGLCFVSAPRRVVMGWSLFFSKRRNDVAG